MSEERIEVTELSSENGVERKKVTIICPTKRNILGDAHSLYSRDEVKQAKLNYKLKNKNE